MQSTRTSAVVGLEEMGSEEGGSEWARQLLIRTLTPMHLTMDLAEADLVINLSYLLIQQSAFIIIYSSF